MFDDGIAGTGIHDPSSRFRMYLVFTFGVFALGSLLYWRSQSFVAADYVDFPKHRFNEITKAGSSNYQIEYLDESLNVK